MSLLMGHNFALVELKPRMLGARVEEKLKVAQVMGVC
jgi:hypothetical protein